MSRPRAGPALVWRIFLATAAVVAVVLATTMLLVSLAARRTADAALARGLAQTRRHVAALLDARERALTSGALQFVQDPYFRTVVINKERPDLLDRADEAATRIRATWVQITDESGVRLAKSDDPSAAPAALGGTALIGGALDGEVMTGAGVAGDTAIFQGVAVPILVPEGRPAGVLMAAWAIDTALASAVKRETASEVVFYLLDAAGAPRVVASTMPPDEWLLRLLRGAAPSQGRVEVELGGRHWVGQREPLRTAGGDVLGGVVTLRSREAELAPFDALRDRLAIAGVLGLALAFALSYAVAQRIARPILALTDATRRAAAGDYVGDLPVRAEGEIGALADAVRTMLGGLRERQVVAEYLRGALDQSTTRRPAPKSVTPTGGPFAPGRVAAGRYEIGEVLGVGGAGVVYKALDRELGETVAIKTLRPDALAGETEVERLRSEIRLARRISHRNVVRTHDIGEVDGVYFITMEYVAGLSLAELLDRDGPLPVPVTLSVGEQLCSALAVAHEQGVIHRDIKPQNLILQPDGTLKVMDFGIARLAERTTALTAAGLVVGTPAYMAPEQLFSEEVDARADVYAAGMVLYECLTGRRPFAADSLSALIGRVLTEEPPPPHVANPAVPEALSALVMRAIARSRDQRPPSAAAMHEELVRVR